MTLKKFNADYMQKVVREAFASERRSGNIAFDIVTYNGNNWVGYTAQASGYTRVDRRISYRLSNNKWLDTVEVSNYSELPKRKVYFKGE